MFLKVDPVFISSGLNSRTLLFSNLMRQFQELNQSADSGCKAFPR